MKIAIDARFYGPEGTGIGKYVEKLLTELERLDSKNEYFVILRKSNFNLFNPKKANFKKIQLDAHWYSLKEQVLLPAMLYKIKPDLVHFPHFNVPLVYPGKFVVTIHDIIQSEFKGSSYTSRKLPFYLLKRAGYELTIRQAVNRAERIFVPSDFVKKKLIKSFNLKKEKIIVTYEAAEAPSGQVSEGEKKRVFAKYAIKGPFILYVGNAYPYKNLTNLLKALQELKKASLVYVSSRDVFVEKVVEEAKELGVADRLITTGYVPDSELAVLYKEAESFVFPSLSEGFGLPGLESMAAGCPVVASDIEVFREVYGEAAVYFDPKKPKDIAAKIESVINDKKLRTRQIDKGFERVKKYSWERLARETLTVYEAH